MAVLALYCPLVLWLTGGDFNRGPIWGESVKQFLKS
jgi:hypothetical protein